MRRGHRAISIALVVLLVTAVLPLFVGTAAATVTQLATSTATCTGVKTCADTVNAALPNGALVVTATIDGISSGTGVTVGSRSLSFTPEEGASIASTAWWAVWVVQNDTATGPTTVYVNWTAANGEAMVTAQWLGNVTAATAVDVVGSVTAVINSTAITATAITTVPGDWVDLLVGSEFVHATGSATLAVASDTLITTGSYGTQGSGGSEIGWYAAGTYAVDASSGSFTEGATLSHTANWIAVAIAFKTAAIPAAPTGLTDHVAPTDIALAWSDGVGPIVNETVQDAVWSGSCGPYTSVNSTGGKTGKAVVEGLTPTDAYCVRVETWNTTGHSAFTTLTDIVTPAALTASFVYAPNPTHEEHPVYFTSTITGGTLPYTYAWNFGDGSTSAAADPVHLYVGDGTYTVYMNVSDAGILVSHLSVSHVVSIVNSISATFTFAPAQPEAGVPVVFTVQVISQQPPFTYAWTFGDGGTSTVANPSHTYATGGSYPVYCNVTESDGDETAVYSVLTVAVVTPLSVTFVVSPVIPNATQAATFSSFPVGGAQPYTYAWAFGDGGKSDAANPTHTFQATGSFRAYCNVTGADGTTATTNVLIAVTAPQRYHNITYWNNVTNNVYHNSTYWDNTTENHYVNTTHWDNTTLTYWDNSTEIHYDNTTDVYYYNTTKTYWDNTTEPSWVNSTFYVNTTEPHWNNSTFYVYHNASVYTNTTATSWPPPLVLVAAGLAAAILLALFAYAGGRRGARPPRPERGWEVEESGRRDEFSPR